jgi:glycogen debranching enzyme
LTLNGKDLPLVGLAIQSVVGKWMGPLTEWPKFLKVFSDKGYNMIHFTPLNERGDSNSPYSIYNQIAFSPDLFGPDTSIGDQHTAIADMTSMMEKEYGLLSLTDVVWNHTAENSDWLQDHPEAGYNLDNSPHLIAAYQLDSALLDFSNDLRHLGYPTTVNTVDDILKIMEGIKTHVLGGLRLWEFYIVEPQVTVAMCLRSWKVGQYNKLAIPDPDAFNKLSFQEKAVHISAKGLGNAETMGERFKKTINQQVGAAYLRAVFGDYSDEKSASAQRDLTNIVNEINLPFYKQFDEDRATILENIFNRVKYVRLDLRKGEITEE